MLMKKMILFLFLLFGITGCTNNHAEDPVREYLNKYRNHDKEVSSSIEELLRQEDLLKEQSELYELIMKKQYIDLEYQMKGETYHGNKAVITVDITVYDYQHSKEKAIEEREEKRDEYYLSDGTLLKDKFVNLQLKYMKEEKRRVKYTIDFDVTLHDKEWVLETPDYKVIEKIHGLYNYESS